MELINAVDGEFRIVMEHTGRYSEVFTYQISKGLEKSMPEIGGKYVVGFNGKNCKDLLNQDTSWRFPFKIYPQKIWGYC